MKIKTKKHDDLNYAESLFKCCAVIIEHTLDAYVPSEILTWYDAEKLRRKKVEKEAYELMLVQRKSLALRLTPEERELLSIDADGYHIVDEE